MRKIFQEIKSGRPRVWLALLAGYALTCLIVFPVIAGPEANITLKAKTLNEVQIFFDTGAGFNENDTLTLLPKEMDGYQSIRFRLPEQSINAFRIDFGTKPGTIIVKNMKVYNGLFRKTYSPQDIIDTFANTNQLYLDVQGRRLIIESDMLDPYFYMVGPFTKASHLLPMWALNMVQLIFVVLSFIAFFALIKLFQPLLARPKTWCIPNRKRLTSALCRDYTFIALLAAYIVIHYCFSVTVSPDSISFYRYVNILNGNMPMSEWFITRGFTFPVFLWISEQIFGAGHDGIRTGYLLIALGYAAIFYRLLKEELGGESERALLFFLLFGFILCDSLFFGYTHLMLTESVAGLIILTMLLVSRKWVRFSLFETGRRKGFFLYGLLLVLLSSSLWFLKESHWPAGMIAIIAAVAAEKLFGEKSWKNFGAELTALLLISIIVIGQVSLWNNYIVNISNPTLSEFAGELNEKTQKEAEENNEANQEAPKSQGSVFEYHNSEEHDLLQRSSEDLINSVLLYGLRDKDIFHFKIKDRKWFEMERPELLEIFDSKNANFAVDINVPDHPTQKTIFYYSASESFGLMDAFGAMTKTIAKYPFRAIKAYALNYAELSNIYRDGQIFMLLAEENEILPYRTYRLTSKMENIYYMWNPAFDVPHLHSGRIPNKTLADLFMISEVKSNLMFSLGFLAAPLIVIYLIVVRIFFKRKRTMKGIEKTLFTLSLTAFLYGLSVAVTGEAHDRYISNAYPIVLLQWVMIFTIIWGRIKSNILKDRKMV